MEIASQTTPRLLMSLIGVPASLEKTIPMGRLRMRPFQWYLKTNWQYPQSLDLKIPVSNFLKSHLQWWKDPKNIKNGLSFSSTGTQYPYFHKCIKLRLGSSFRKHDSQWQLDRSRKLLHINVLELKAVFIALIHLTYQTIAICRRQPVPPNERKRRPGFHPRQDRYTTLHSPGGLVPASLARGT